MAGRNRWLPAAAGAAALAVVAGVLAVAATRGPALRGPPGAALRGPAGAPVASRPVTASTPAPPDAVVHDGDRVRGQGQVVALPGRPVRLCSGAEPDIARIVPAYCPVGITLVGADLARLGDRRELRGVVWGNAEVTGVYRDRTITVTGQRVPPVTDLQRAEPLVPEFPPDCRPPAGGWPRAQVRDVARADRYVAAHPDVLSSLSIAYPVPTPAGAVSTQVLLIGTTGDVAEATRQIRKRYEGPLCVRSVPHSRAQMLAARTVLIAALTDPTLRIRYGLLGGAGEGSVAGDPRTSIKVLVYDEQARSLRESAGADLVDIEPQLSKLT